MNANKPKLNFTDKLPPMTIAPMTTVQPVVNKIIENTPQKKKKKKKPSKRCQLKGCKKKLSITAFDCKCEKRFCNLHIYSENHNCTFDYKSLYKQNLIDRAELGGGEADRVGDRV